MERLSKLPNSPPPEPQTPPLISANPEKLRLLLAPAKRFAEAIDTSLSVAPLSSREFFPYNSPSKSFIWPLLTDNDKSRKDEILAPVPFIKKSSEPVFDAEVIVISRAALMADLISILPALLRVKSSTLAAASPSMRTPTPASVAIIRIRPEYIPPRAVESIA